MDININTVMADLLAALAKISDEISRCADQLGYISGDLSEIRDAIGKDD
jgi:hypothetical protein